ncbi:MAG TPA: peptidylprolyl isomerase [Thermoanaerobaculia bacterium]|nr:peptidylprolyl isomerase [Thermoanaerobaculia bacterium]
MSPVMRACRLAGLLLPSLLLACTSTRPPAGPADLPELAVADADVRALLLLMVDRQWFEPLTVDRAARGDAALREDLADALGRAGDSRGRGMLEGLLIDEEARVRRAAAFALGELEDQAAVPALTTALRDPDRETGVLAVEALGKLGSRAVDVAEALLPLDEGERWARLLPHLFRFKDEARVALAERALTLPGAELHAQAAYALGRDALPPATGPLRLLLADPDGWIRSWAARGLGAIGVTADLPRLRPLLDDADASAVVQALRAAQSLITRQEAPAPAEWEPRLLELVSDPRPGVRVTALEAAGAWPLAGALGEAVAARAASGAGREREVALLSLAAARHPRAGELVEAAAAASGPVLRARAAEAAGRLGAAALLERLSADSAAMVRGAAVAARLEAAGGDAAETDTAASPAAAAVARLALADPDHGVRASAFGWLAEHPVVPLEVLDPAARAALTDREVESGVSAVQALAARGKAEPLERGAVVALLEQIAAANDLPLRRAAAAGLVELDRPEPPRRPFETGNTLETYQEIVQRTRRPREVELVTARGPVRLRLACPQAPLTCLNFLTLAGQGYFDGLRFHRIVPDFVVQDGDPRGDGSGGPGYSIRDEINRLRYRRGVLGMALSGPDTGGSQWFVTLTPQPHLDGGYTVFGEVVSGMEFLDQLLQGDAIERVREVP